MSSPRQRVVWTHPKLGEVPRTTTVNLTFARSQHLEDTEAIRRILAIACLDGLHDADAVTIIKTQEVHDA